MQMNWLWFLC